MPSADHARLLALLRARPLAEEMTVERRRAVFERLAGMFPLPRDVRVTRTTVAGRAAEWLEPPGAVRDRVLLWFHGGAYVVGSCATHRELVARVARAARARALLLEYRLAPEWPFPKAFEDAVAAVRELVANGVAPDRLALCGDSAGGGLAISTLCALRDRGLPLPAVAALIAPWTDLALTGASLWQFQARDPLLDLELLNKSVLVYLNGADPRDARCSPLYADLRGLPPLLIQVGTSDLLHDDATRLAVRARAAGVAVTLETWEQMVHVWHLFAAQLSEGREACERLGSFLREALAAGGCHSRGENKLAAFTTSQAIDGSDDTR